MSGTARPEGESHRRPETDPTGPDRRLDHRDPRDRPAEEAPDRDRPDRHQRRPGPTRHALPGREQRRERTDDGPGRLGDDPGRGPQAGGGPIPSHRSGNRAAPNPRGSPGRRKPNGQTPPSARHRREADESQDELGRVGGDPDRSGQPAQLQVGTGDRRGGGMGSGSAAIGHSSGATDGPQGTTQVKSVARPRGRTSHGPIEAGKSKV